MFHSHEGCRESVLRHRHFSTDDRRARRRYCLFEQITLDSSWSAPFTPVPVL